MTSLLYIAVVTQAVVLLLQHYKQVLSLLQLSLLSLIGLL